MSFTDIRDSAALNRDVLLPRPAGRFLFGGLIGRESGAAANWNCSPGAGGRQQVVIDQAWLAVAVRFVRWL